MYRDADSDEPMGFIMNFRLLRVMTFYWQGPDVKFRQPRSLLLRNGWSVCVPMKRCGVDIGKCTLSEIIGPDLLKLATDGPLTADREAVAAAVHAFESMGWAGCRKVGVQPFPMKPRKKIRRVAKRARDSDEYGVHGVSLSWDEVKALLDRGFQLKDLETVLRWSPILKKRPSDKAQPGEDGGAPDAGQPSDVDEDGESNSE